MTAAVAARLSARLSRARELNAAMEAGAVPAGSMNATMRELGALEPLLAASARRDAAVRDIADLTEVLAGCDGGTAGGREMAAMAGGELADAEAALAEVDSAITTMLLPRDEADDRGAILEVRAGTGGDEACLFARELFDMYRKYVLDHGWQFQLLDAAYTEHGGLREGSAAANGLGVYARLKFEAGVHRVQRVPVTEAQGRVHTSAVSVAVLAEAEEVDLEIKASDLRIDTFRSSGPGGQSVNKTESAVRITHIPTGATVSMQDERSQAQNRAKAMRVLRSRVFEAAREARDKERNAEMRVMLGSGDRSDRIRTYNFRDNRVTDHRVGVTKCVRVLMALLLLLLLLCGVCAGCVFVRGCMCGYMCVYVC
jgi:peptide chain release factor 1